MKLKNLKYYTRKTNFAKHRKHKRVHTWHTAHIFNSTWNISLRRLVIKAKQTGSQENKRKCNELELWYKKLMAYF